MPSISGIAIKHSSAMKGAFSGDAAANKAEKQTNSKKQPYKQLGSALQSPCCEPIIIIFKRTYSNLIYLIFLTFAFLKNIFNILFQIILE